MFDDLDLTKITGEHTREHVARLLNLIETLGADLRAAQAEIQRLRDEVNRLKGEQGKPSVKPGTKPTATDHSSEQQRRQPRSWKKGNKVQQVQIDREQVLPVDPAVLPPDAEFKGYEEVVVQDVVVHTDNVLFRKEKFYSPSQRKIYLAELPPGYQGEFGPGVRAMVIIFAFACQMTEPKILDWFRQVGVQISAGQISNLLIKGQHQFHAEKNAVYQAGLSSSPWQHLDDTATRVNGQNHHCHVVNNPLYSAYLTTPSKDRLSVIDVLRNGQPRTFRLNGEALRYLATAGVSGITRQQLSHWPQNRDLDEATMHRLLEEYLPKLGMQTRKNEQSRLAQFMERVRRSDNKRFILTTREYILSEALNRYERLSGTEIAMSKSIISLEDYTHLIRARILYKHLFFSDLPSNLKTSLLPNERYWDVIRHRNYNPRVIEHAVSLQGVVSLSPDEFVSNIFATLNDPSAVWEVIFENLPDMARLILLAVASLPTEVLLEDVRL